MIHLASASNRISISQISKLFRSFGSRSNMTINQSGRHFNRNRIATQLNLYKNKRKTHYFKLVTKSKLKTVAFKPIFSYVF